MPSAAKRGVSPPRHGALLHLYKETIMKNLTNAQIIAIIRRAELAAYRSGR